MVVKKKKLPVHGHLGMYAGRTAQHVDEVIRETYAIPEGAKITKTYMYSDPPYRVYDCEVTTKRKKE